MRRLTTFLLAFLLLAASPTWAANELSVTARLLFSKAGEPELSVGQVEFTVTVTGTNYIRHVQNIGLSEEALTLGDMTPGGWCYFENLDATNFVEIRGATGETDLVKMKAGEFSLLRMSADASAPYVIADTATVDLLVACFEN